eukprot:11056589-Lingulodinium_polyedra.AAC.1
MARSSRARAREAAPGSSMRRESARTRAGRLRGASGSANVRSTWKTALMTHLAMRAGTRTTVQCQGARLRMRSMVCCVSHCFGWRAAGGPK